MKQPSQGLRPVSLAVRIGKRSVELPWTAETLSRVTDGEIDDWIVRQNLPAPELGTLAEVLWRLSCPNELTPLGDSGLGRVSKAARRRLPVSVARQIRQLRKERRKLLAGRKTVAKSGVMAPAAAVPVAVAPATAASVSQSPLAVSPDKISTLQPPEIPAREPAVQTEPVVEPLIPPVAEKPLATDKPAVSQPVAAPAEMPVTSLKPPAFPPPAPQADFLPVPVSPQVVVQVPQIAPVQAPQAAAVPSSPVVSPAPSPAIPAVPPRSPFSAEDHKETGDEEEDWEEETGEFGDMQAVKGTPFLEFFTGAGFIGILFWIAVRKA